VATAPEPDEIYRRTQEEGRRRLSRPPAELAATALVGGFDVTFGVAALGITSALVSTETSSEVGHVAGSLAFPLAFVFVVVGRSELFTENFLVPIAGLSRDRSSWLKLGELWVVTLVLNLVGGTVLALVLTANGVLLDGTSDVLVSIAERVAGYDTLTALASGIVAGALMTLMTWLVEGAGSPGVRVAVAWAVGFLLVLGYFNHAIVSTIEIVFGLRFGADVSTADLFRQLGLAVASNLIGGVFLVTLARTLQAASSSGSSK
jgi:formate-nitrite transporter family protein